MMELFYFSLGFPVALAVNLTLKLLAVRSTFEILSQIEQCTSVITCIQPISQFLFKKWNLTPHALEVLSPTRCSN